MNDNDFKQAYERSKQQYPAPGRIKRQVLNQAKQPFSWRIYLPGKEWMALAGALCCLVVIYAMNSVVRQAPIAVTDGLEVAVAYHGYENELPEASKYQQKLMVYNQKYTDNLATLKAFHSKHAMLAKHEGNWLFTDCNNQKITVSPQLMQDLMQTKRADAELMAGNFVELVFDDQGRLIQITQSRKNLC
ncbi:hypothetical protein FJ444_03100 [Aestuariibacter sp. GS-14]|uniref:hypothetical protein n=1 Tax=Aestuariibacter sp. GS-14 TaxID=2590670 RepID=UPI001128E700|nr:hypothetical protein [Aestuariibacter sp. GS-14]TPV60630.1 hypothetical protein FJ444_03100 [Aestuariibacter sp. GS-14]